MQRINLSEGWRYAHLGRDDWREVTLPHDAMLSEPRSQDSAGGTNTGWFACEDYEYVREVTTASPCAYLDFEGVYHRAEVYVDGAPVPAHPNGYFGFHIPLPEGTHQVRVIARNQQQPSSRWYSGAGIYRPVTLVELPDLHIVPDSIWVQTVDAKQRKITVSFQTSAAAPVRVEILDGERCLGDKTGEHSVAFALPEAGLWSPEHPRLYTARLTCREDVQTVRFGIRTITVSPEQGFCVNGERVLLLGACIHHDNGILGAAGHPAAEYRKIALLKKAGYNAIRSAHNPASRALLNACDELGVLVLDEYVDMWYIHKTQYDYAAFFEQRWQDDLRLLVEKDRNHPSVVMYSIGNEVSETAQKKGIALTRQMVQHLHQLDPGRPVTCGINIFFNYLSSMGFGVYSDEKAKAAAEKSAKAAPKKKKAVGSEFINNVAGLMGAGFMKFGATLHGSDVKTRDAFAQLDVAGYNYGVNRYEKDLKKYPSRVILGSETFCSDAAVFYDLAQTHPSLIGDFVWTGMDYLGEVGLGAWEYHEDAPDFDHGPGWLTAGAGTLDLIGRETCQMAYTQVAFRQSPIRMGVIPVRHAAEKHSPAAWRMTNAVESWSWNGCDGMPTTVEVYARGHAVELLLNGASLGRKRLGKGILARFPVTYQPGTLTAVAYDASGAELARTELVTAGDETRLRLLPEALADGTKGLIYLRVQYTDGEGTLKPLERAPVTLRVTGGTLLGFGSACSYSEAGYLTDTAIPYHGEALAVISAHGAVVVEAESAAGSARVEISASR